MLSTKWHQTICLKTWFRALHLAGQNEFHVSFIKYKNYFFFIFTAACYTRKVHRLPEKNVLPYAGGCIPPPTRTNMALSHSLADRHTHTNKQAGTDADSLILIDGKAEIASMCASGHLTWTGSRHHMGSAANRTESNLVVHQYEETGERAFMSSGYVCGLYYVIMPLPPPGQKVIFDIGSPVSSILFLFFVSFRLYLRITFDAILFDLLPNRIILSYRRDNFSNLFNLIRPLIYCIHGFSFNTTMYHRWSTVSLNFVTSVDHISTSSSCCFIWSRISLAHYSASA